MMIHEAGARNLAAAVIARACADYSQHYHDALLAPPGGRRRKLEKFKAVEFFFTSELFELWAGLAAEDCSGTTIIVTLRRKTEERMQAELLRRIERRQHDAAPVG